MHRSESSSLATYAYQPRRAFRALRTLIADPNDTAQVFTIIEALSGRAPLRMLARFERDEDGRRLLASRPSLLRLLASRETLERMPEGSLAHAYLAFIDAEGITADGLVEASEQGETGSLRTTGDLDYVSDRMRDTHDLWHAVTGYQGDVLGEAALLAFSAAQTRNPGVLVIALAAIFRARDLEVARTVTRAFFEGRRAAFLPAVPWESLLPLPLEEVRARLRVEPVRPYRRFATDWKRVPLLDAPAARVVSG